MKSLNIDFFILMTFSVIILAVGLSSPTIESTICAMAFLLAACICKVGAEICKTIEKTNSQGGGL